MCTHASTVATPSANRHNGSPYPDRGLYSESNIDELPRLLAILIGYMRLVGPPTSDL